MILLVVGYDKVIATVFLLIAIIFFLFGHTNKEIIMSMDSYNITLISPIE